MSELALVGLMNIAAMVALAVFIFIEKTTRYGVPARQLAGALMLAAATNVSVAVTNGFARRTPSEPNWRVSMRKEAEPSPALRATSPEMRERLRRRSAIP